MANFYIEKGPAIFSRSLAKRLESAGGLIDELYDSGELEVGLAEIFDRKLLSEAETMVMAVAYDIETRETVVFRSWDLDGNDCRMADVARATSAAPTYFEPHRVQTAGGSAYACIDGGVVANNPTLLAYLESRLDDPNSTVDMMVSIGTGRRDVPCLLKDAKNFGLAQWAPHLVDIMFSGGAELVDQECRLLLGNRYVRLQVDLPEDVPMDATDPQNMAIMRLAAERIIDSPAANQAFGFGCTA